MRIGDEEGEARLQKEPLRNVIGASVKPKAKIGNGVKVMISQ